MAIECKGNEIKVWVNGDMVNHGFNCTAEKGQIAVQAEGSEVEFRKLLLTPSLNESDYSYILLISALDKSDIRLPILLITH